MLKWARCFLGLLSFLPCTSHAGVSVNARASVVYARPVYGSWGAFAAFVMPNLVHTSGQGILVAGVSKNIHTHVRTSLSSGVLLAGHHATPLLGVNVTVSSASLWAWKYQAFEQAFVVFGKEHISVVWLQQLTARMPQRTWSAGVETQYLYAQTSDQAVGPVVLKDISKHMQVSASFQWHTTQPMQTWLRVGFLL